MSVRDGTTVVALNEWCGCCMGAIMGDASGKGMVEQCRGVTEKNGGRVRTVSDRLGF